MKVRSPALEALARSRERFLAAMDGLDDAQFVTRPPGGGWTVSQNAEHIARSEAAIARGFSVTLGGRPGAKAEPLDAFRRLLWTFRIYTMVRIRTRAPLDPPESMPKAGVLALLAANRAALLASLGDEPAKLATVKLRHPVFGPLTGDEMLAFTALHEDRHRAQVGRIRRALGLPAAPGA